jgi:hypothetical protein
MDTVILLLPRFNVTFAFLIYENKGITSDLKIRPQWVIMFHVIGTERDRVEKERFSYVSKQFGIYT